MHSLESILTHPVSPEDFYAQIGQRFAPRAKVIRATARLVSEKYPELRAAIIHKADEALKGLFVLPGTGGKLHFVGNPPRWSERPFPDNEYVWSLNRMAHWISLLRAFSLTGDSRYAQKVVEELHNWIQTCTRPPLDDFRVFDRPTPWRSLEAGIRMFTSWRLIVPHLVGTDFLTPTLLAEFAGSLFEHGEVLEKICPQIWPNADHNHYLMENLGLLEIATLMPELSQAGHWKKHAVYELERCAKFQMTAEGGQIEGCPLYHNECVEFFVHALSLARANDIQFSPAYLATVEKSIDYAAHSLRPSGTIVPWGDSDANAQMGIRSLLDGFRLFGNPDYLRIAVNCAGVENFKAYCVSTIWDHADTDELLSEIDRAATSGSSVSFPTHSWQKELKQVMLRTDWSHDALSVFFACRTPVNNGHAHLDPGGFDFTAYGRPLVVDPGRFCYREDDDRYIFKSAAYHNTLTINGRDPFEYKGLWAFGPQKPSWIEDIRIEPGCLAAFARHDNYKPVIHRRAVALIGNEALLVIDRLENLQPGDLLQLYFHLDSTKVNLDAKAGHAETADIGQANVLIVPGADLAAELLPGRVSDFIDIQRPSTRVCLTASASDKSSHHLATLIVPWASSSLRPSATTPQLIKNADGLSCTFQVTNKPYSFSWPEAK